MSDLFFRAIVPDEVDDFFAALAVAFSDPRPKSVGATGELTTRNAMTLTNVAYNGRYTWANDTLATLEQQAMVPLTSRHPPPARGRAGRRP